MVSFEKTPCHLSGLQNWVWDVLTVIWVITGLQNWVWDVLTVISVVTVGSMSPASIWRIASQSDSLHKIFSCWRKISFFFFKYFKLHLSSKLSPISSSSLKISPFSFTSFYFSSKYFPFHRHFFFSLWLATAFLLCFQFIWTWIYLNFWIFCFLEKEGPPKAILQPLYPVNNQHHSQIATANMWW